MPISVIDLMKDILPKTNCKDCGFPTCMSFATMVVTEKFPIEKCPHLDPETLEACQKELNEQYKSGKWLKKDAAADALKWAKERASSMKMEDIASRVGGQLSGSNGDKSIELKYFLDTIIAHNGKITKRDGTELNWWEQTFLYNHFAQGGVRKPVGSWKGLEEIPNTVSKMKSMVEHVEEPLRARFTGGVDDLVTAARDLGAEILYDDNNSADVILLFRPLPKVPIKLLFWDEDKDDDFNARAKMLFDETITEHLDIESIMFLSERLKQLLCGEEM